jgi:hypothetical protein
LIELRTLAAKYRFCSRLLVLSAVLSLCVSNSVATTLSEYHEAIDYAISDLQAVMERGEEEAAADYETRFTETIDRIRLRLPPNQQIESEHGKWTTDNSWLHKALDDLQRAPIEERPSKVASLLEAMGAVDERVAELENAERIDGDKAATKQKLESILARPEYASASRGPNALTRLIRDFIRWLQGLLPELPEIQPGRARTVSVIVQILVVGAALLLILYIARLLFVRFRRPRKAKVRKKREARIVLGERLKPEDTATDLLSEAEALARNGDLRAAIRKGYIALLVELGDRDLISLAQYKTNRDYLRSVSNRPQLHSPLKKLTESFERHWYGFAQATPNDWQDFRAGYREALQTGN